MMVVVSDDDDDDGNLHTILHLMMVVDNDNIDIDKDMSC